METISRAYARQSKTSTNSKNCCSRILWCDHWSVLSFETRVYATSWVSAGGMHNSQLNESKHIRGSISDCALFQYTCAIYTRSADPRCKHIITCVACINLFRLAATSAPITNYMGMSMSLYGALWALRFMSRTLSRVLWLQSITNPKKVKLFLFTSTWTIAEFRSK